MHTEINWQDDAQEHPSPQITRFKTSNARKIVFPPRQ
jgi:hypothetical protein